MAQKTSFGNISPETAALFVCDMQERFKPAIKYFDDIAVVAKRLIEGANILAIPVIVTEQYPKGLGHTVEELDISKAIGVYPKTKFSMVVPEVEAQLTQNLTNVKSIILLGIEAHVCIQQTTLDLLARGYEVHVVADAVSSRSMMDRQFAYERLRQFGAIITTSESVLFQLLGDKDHPKFKQIQGLVKTSAPVSGLASNM
ncbi:isochorismatase domain-containing protein 1 [Strongylocentrotus purpuratus]|uniref:Isochorismatase domain-containing protein 1 n=1 Tax=Strongylocentrotus purpuratus TaxID=7668 RepID=A0A7M7ST34_STRPU|nr:isochorismatase domain-containing protein 1-like [Strongylocentrotus purpuratus]XP_030841456.1 isochorismatase domain-containing protein 1 [Strongylocentrotus purpuratus]|eukprot:XP_780645.1 PREDICTED: isochorismatase domain-containing protein 1 [Strongylocentrotus purpuratus]